ncbi:MAG: hypothetical protein AB7K41_06120 [Bdellovibrionales bacterium]
MTTGIMDEIEVQNIPVPSQIPTRLDLTQLPPQILRSGAVEALANQNEDLMARLGVAMRRAALLENRISELEQTQQALQHKVSLAQDEALVLQQKDRVLVERYSEHENNAREARDQLQLLETQFAELYVTSKDRTRVLTEQIENLGTRLERFLRYRRRIVKAARQTKLKLQNLQIRWHREEETSRELKNRLGEAATRIQNMAKQANQNQKQLVENYESSLKELRDQTQKLENENRAYAQKTDDYQALFEKTVAFENRLIHEQRQFSEYRQNSEKELALLQIEISDLRTQHKTSLIEVENLQKNYADVVAERQTLKEQNTKFIDQVETLQLLWQDSQTQIEKTNNKNAALQSLNQQLSTNLQQQRHEIAQLKAQLEAQSVSTSERMKEIKGQLQMMGRSAQLNFIEGDPATGSPEEATSSRVLSKIDTLIAEIQSGFKRQLPAGASEFVSSSADKRGNGETSAP